MKRTFLFIALLSITLYSCNEDIIVVDDLEQVLIDRSHEPNLRSNSSGIRVFDGKEDCVSGGKGCTEVIINGLNTTGVGVFSIAPGDITDEVINNSSYYSNILSTNDLNSIISGTMTARLENTSISDKVLIFVESGSNLVSVNVITE